MPRILGACLARHFLRKLISRLFLGPGDLESGENAAEKAPMAASMIESVNNTHFTGFFPVYPQNINDIFFCMFFFFVFSKAHDALVFEANVMHLSCNWMAV